MATEFRSSAFAAAGNDFEPVTPASVAFIASTACSPNRLSSVTRRLSAVSPELDVAAVDWDIGMPAIDIPDVDLDPEDLEAAIAPATTSPETTTASAAVTIRLRVERIKILPFVSLDIWSIGGCVHRRARSGLLRCCDAWVAAPAPANRAL